MLLQEVVATASVALRQFKLIVPQEPLGGMGDVDLSGGVREGEWEGEGGGGGGRGGGRGERERERRRGERERGREMGRGRGEGEGEEECMLSNFIKRVPFNISL